MLQHFFASKHKEQLPQGVPASGDRALRLLQFLLVLALVLLLLGLAVGSEGLGLLLSMHADATALQIVWSVRLPRTLGALLAGALLGLAGCVAQGLFRNPLADPYLLGSASGAALGVALVFWAGGVATGTFSVAAYLGLTGAAFIGALLAVVLTLVLAQGGQASTRLLLAGVIVGVVLGACRDLVVMSRPAILQSVQSYALGSTAAIGWQACFIMALVLLLTCASAWILARVLDGLVLGHATATSLGLPLGLMQSALIAVLALATAAAVAQTGLLAFVGLAAPHLVRSIVRTRHNWLLLLSSSMGAVLLAAADLLARWLIAPEELPVGVLTALLGGAYLLWLMQRQRRRAALR